MVAAAHAGVADAVLLGVVLEVKCTVGGVLYDPRSFCHTAKNHFPIPSLLLQDNL